MKKAYVFVEAPSDAAILRRILPHDLLAQAELVDGGGSGSILSLACSVLVRRRKPVAILMDADSTDPAAVEQKRVEAEDVIRVYAGSVAAEVILAVPEIEGWFFAAPESVEGVLGRPVSPEFVVLGKRDPKGVLQLLAEKAGTAWDVGKAMALLDQQAIERIRALPEVAKLVRFLESVQTSGQAA